MGVDFLQDFCYDIPCAEADSVGQSGHHGGIAQLGERLNGIQEVSGSIPLISTINNFILRTHKTSTREGMGV